MSARNERSEFVANRQLALQSRYYEKFWAVPVSRSSAKTSKVSRETIKFSSRSWKQRLQFIVYCSQVVDKFWR